tara:strand:+ start:5722 stop:6402 length:681 start_codon:yes stop_codon:yes gene_type:complete
MNANLSIAHLIAQASVLVQIIMGLLMLASVVSWAVIISKQRLLKRTRQASEKFEERFWSGGNLSDLYDSVTRNKEADGLIPIFSSGFDEYKRQQQGGHSDPDDSIAAVHRQMRVTQVREIERLEGGLALLATIGSTSPYVGLFGTVWGIMNAFIGISNMKQASLAVVAPGIAEALIATAMGLFAAIPAVVAYNFFTRNVESLENQYHTFSEEMIGIIERGLRGGKS